METQNSGGGCGAAQDTVISQSCNKLSLTNTKCLQRTFPLAFYGPATTGWPAVSTDLAILVNLRDILCLASASCMTRRPRLRDLWPGDSFAPRAVLPPTTSQHVSGLPSSSHPRTVHCVCRHGRWLPGHRLSVLRLCIRARQPVLTPPTLSLDPAHGGCSRRPRSKGLL